MATRTLVYDVGDKPKFKNLLLYAFQLLLAILAATVAVPTAIGLPTQIPSAILGAGVGTLVYIFFTKRRSPIVISSSFAFLPALGMAVSFGYMGILAGGLFAGAVYVIIALIVKIAGTRWINKIMPPVIIGPVVALIGLSLAPSAIGNLTSANYAGTEFESYNWVALICGLTTLFTVVLCTVQNRSKGIKLIPFIIGIGAGYLMASIFTVIGNACNNDYLKIIDWTPLTNNFSKITINSFFSVPKISIVEGIKEMITGKLDASILAADAEATLLTPAGVGVVALAFCPIAFVSFAEHLADHKNMSNIIGHDLINDQPGLHRTLLGDGVGTMAGTAFGICPNTSYGEGLACVAMTRNASVLTTFTTACICIILSFLAPFSLALQTVPKCVMGGVCLALYGYISVSGLKMFKEVDLDDNVNLLTVSSILIAGIGGLILLIPPVYTPIYNELKEIVGYNVSGVIQISSVATALVLGILVYQLTRVIHYRERSKVMDVNLEAINEDFVRMYLKKFSNDRLAKALMMFGFLHESVELTTAQLSNFLHSEEMLNLRSAKELNELIEMFELKGNTKGLNKKSLIKLIRENCLRIEKSRALIN